MKIIYTALLAILLCRMMQAQAPDKMSYQAVVRDVSNHLVVNHTVGMQISILKTSASGPAVYVETQTPSTNANGLVSLEIGKGVVVSGDFASIDWANGPYFIKTETDPVGGTNYTITGTSQLMSVPYALHAKTAQNALVYTAEQITSLMPTEGTVVFNSTEHLYQIYQGGAWHSFKTDCWPEPTSADAGAGQTLTDGSTVVTLAANTPAWQHGTGRWSILSGAGGRLADDTDPQTTFSGLPCTAYTLLWTISTSCSSSSDTVNIAFSQTPSIADAGADQTLGDGTTTATLSANTPAVSHGKGSWTIVQGEGGRLSDDTDPHTAFTGKLHTVYILRWTISTPCSNSTDDVTIRFNQDGTGSPVSDYDGNVYKTTYIGDQLWMTENLKTTHQADGTAIPAIEDINSNGTTDDEWESLGDNNTDKAYCNSASGFFYTYAAAKDACPTGWHLPTDADWTELERYIAAGGHSGQEGTALKSTSYWEEDGNGTDDYGFTAYPVGSRYDGTGTIDGEGYNGNWWSSTETSDKNAYFRFLHYNHPYLYRFSFHKSNGFNVRCIKDR